MDLAPKEQAFPPMAFLDLQLRLVEIVVWLQGSGLTQPTEKLAIRKENVPAQGANKFKSINSKYFTVLHLVKSLFKFSEFNKCIFAKTSK